MLSDDEFHAAAAAPDEDEAPAHEDAETWQDYHSEFLVAMWHRLKDHAASMGVYVLDAATFHDFAHFCYEHSSGRLPPC